MSEVTSLRRTGSAQKRAFAQSTNPLAISTEANAATARSHEEVNTIGTSFSPRGPTFSGSATSEATVGGVYDGGQGDDTLTFRATLGGIVGVTPIRLEVLDGQSQVIDTVDFGLGYQAGDAKTLANGLTLSLGNGTVAAGNQFEVAVSSSVGSSVDPTKPFNGSRNEAPNFEPSLAVVAGSLEINGTQINVSDSDSINSLLAKISASTAGVVASFDATTEQVLLTQKTEGSAHTIEFGPDTSGFLAATKLDSAIETPGTDDDRTRTLASVAAFSGIASGTFFVNGNSFDVDVLTDSLNDVMERINQSDADARAAVGTDSKRFRIVSTTTGGLTIADGTSGFFTALGLNAGAIEPQAQARRKVKLKQPERIRTELSEFKIALNRVFGTTFSSSAAPGVAQAQSTLQQAIVKGVKGAASNPQATVVKAHGLEFRFGTGNEVLDVNHAALRRAIARKPEELAELLTGASGRGLLGALDDALDGIAETLRHQIAHSTGILLDVRG